MKPSRFNVIIPLKNDTFLIFNTFSDSRVVVNKPILETIKQCKCPELLTNEQKKQLDDLKNLGIILSDASDEDKQLEYWFQRIKFDSDTVNVTVLTTMACNMKCVYCFEQGVNSILSMNKNMVSKVCSWILKRVAEARPKNLTVTFFGGEPLLNLDAVYNIANTLFCEMKQQKIVLNLELITNGLLLTKEVVEKLLPFGLRWAKITLDGNRTTHNIMRPRKQLNNSNDIPAGTYDEIIENLKTIRGLVPLIIGGNYDQNTKNSIPALLDDLVVNDFKPKHFKKIAFKPILAFPEHKTSSAHAIEACTFAETNMEDFFWLITETEKRGFPSYRKIGLGPCEAMRDYTYTIDPVGNLYKCAAMAGRKEFCIGNINDDLEDILFSPQNVAYMTSDVWRKCKKCPFVPLCGGGCRLGAMSASGSFDAIACERQYFEKISTRFVADESGINMKHEMLEKAERRQ